MAQKGYDTDAVRISRVLRKVVQGQDKQELLAWSITAVLSYRKSDAYVIVTDGTITMTKNFAELALRRYCSASLIADYDAAGPNEKKVLLQALIATSKDNMIQKMQEQATSRHHIDRNKSSVVNKNCPLTICPHGGPFVPVCCSTKI
jgi:hypothetical protein